MCWIRAGGGCLHEGGGTVLKSLKGVGIKKRGRETRILKRWGQAAAALKRGPGIPLKNPYYQWEKHKFHDKQN